MDFQLGPAAPGGEQAREGDHLPLPQGEALPGVDVPKGELHDVPPQVRRYAALRYQGDATLAERLELLEAHRGYVLEQQRRWSGHLRALDDKIRVYRRSPGEEEPP